MAVRRIGRTQAPDDINKIWNSAPESIPGDVLSGAPDYGGEPVREDPGPIINETVMVARPFTEEKKPPKEPKKAVISGKRPRIKAVLPLEASRTAAVPSAEAKDRTSINIRVPTRLLDRYRAGGPGYQSRIVAVLELFLEEGGQFIEI